MRSLIATTVLVVVLAHNASAQTGVITGTIRDQTAAVLPGGGPIKRDRTFVFLAYEGMRLRERESSLRRVPPVGFSVGDFSSIGSPILDPLSGRPFPGNVIPAARFSPIARRIVDRGSYPEPTLGLTGPNNLRAVNSRPEDDDQFSARIDYQLGRANRFFSRYSYNRQDIHSPCNPFTAAACVPGYPSDHLSQAGSASIVDTHAFTNRVLNEMRVGFNRLTLPRIALTSKLRQGRAILKNTILEVGYVGSKGTRLIRVVDINQAFPGAGSVQSRRPLQAYGSVNVWQPSGNSIYHGMIGRLERRLSDGLSLLTSYTWAHAIDDNASPQDARNIGTERGNANFDRRHRLVVSYVWDLPFGRERRFGSHMSTALDAVLGGWKLAGINEVMSGTPVTVFITGQWSNTGTNNLDRPNATGKDPVFRNRTDRTIYIDPAAFELPPRGSFGNAGRNTVFASGLNNWDLSLAKEFRYEGITIQFRTEFFNVPNHPSFGAPVTQINDPGFGRIRTTRPAQDNRQIQFGLKLLF